MKITHISFSGGGLAGLVNLGIIRYLQMEGLDKHIYSMVGTSMGAFFACVMALGIPAGTMESDLKAFFSEPDRVFFPTKSFINIFQEFGMDYAHVTIAVLEKYFVKLWGHTNVTFLEFTKTTGKDLWVCASCIETGKAMYFSVNETPDVQVLQAIQASMTVPFIFKPLRIGEYHYVDGGVTDNHPVDCFGDKARETMLAVKINLSKSSVSNPMENIASYALHIMQMSFRYWDRQYEKAKYKLFIENPPLDFLPCEYSKEGARVKVTDYDIDRSVECGFTKAFELLKNLD